MKPLYTAGFSLALLLLFAPISHAFEHEESEVHFQEYSRTVIRDNKKHGKPFLLLFAAQWCHWCRIFQERTLTDERVYSYLNQHFINIFIDADIHSSAYQKYKATGLPFTVFLNPDDSLYFKYAGTLYADDFLEVLEGVRESVSAGRSIYEEDASPRDYVPPSELDQSALAALTEQFRDGVLDNFDPKEYGLGTGEKTIYPRTFRYLLKATRGQDREDALHWIIQTLNRGVEHLHDPVEGGFFRYAEKRDWQIPHYEKQADLNAGITLLLYEIDREQSSPELKKAADRTVSYLTSTLFDSQTGAFLSFQEADTYYYFLNKNRRKKVESPEVIDKIFTDRLTLTLIYLIQVMDHTSRGGLRAKVLSSLDFLAAMTLANERPYHYYSLAKNRWSGESGLPDYATLAYLFSRAASGFKNDRYSLAATKVLRSAVTHFHDADKQIFLDPETNGMEDLEFLMEMNGWLALALKASATREGGTALPGAKKLVTYFSGMTEQLEDRMWDARDWEFVESYVPYLTAADIFLSEKPGQ